MPPHHATRWHKKTFEILALKQNFKIEKFAHEPLLLINHDYYSYYWINHIFKQQQLGSQFFKWGLKILLQGFFISLKKMGIKYFPLLLGQSLYVVMKKTN
jgi:hypothetical protein